MSDSQPINLQFRPSDPERPRAELGEGAIRRRVPAHVDPPPPEASYAARFQRRITPREEIDGEAFHGLARHTRTQSDAAVVYYTLPPRPPVRWLHDDFFDGSAKHRRFQSNELPPFVLPPARKTTRLGDETHDEGRIQRVRMLSDAPADFRWLPETARQVSPPIEDQFPEPSDAGQARHVRTVSDEPTPIYKLPPRIVSRDWHAELWPESTDEGKVTRARFGYPDPPPVAPLLPRIPERKPIRPPLEDPSPGQVLSRRPPIAPLAVGEPLRFYLSGAASDGGTQANVDASLGGYRSSAEATRVGFILRNTIAGIRVIAASRANGAGGVGSIFADGGVGLRYSAPGGSPGPRAIPANINDPITLEDGTDPAKWVRVERITSGELVGIAQVEFVDQFNNVFGLADATNTMVTVGGSRYRAVFLRAEEAVQNLKLYVGTLGSVVNGGLETVLAGGAGTIKGPANCFEDWPHKGWMRIETAGGLLREIVYYLIRSQDTIQVLPTGRARLGTSASSGATSDVLYPVPGIRIAWEPASPLQGGSVQSIANESTAPTAVTWSTGRTPAGGIAVGNLNTQQQGVLWIHRETPAVAWGSAEMANEIRVEFVHKGETLTEPLVGLYRQAFNAIEQYELHHGVGAPPVIDINNPPVATFTTLPFVYNVPLASGVDHYFVTNRRNKYDLVSQLTEATRVRVSVFGTEIDAPPSDPMEVTWSASADGTFLATAIYLYEQDGDRKGDRFAVYARFDGSDPDTTLDTPVLVTFAETDGVAKLDWSSAAQLAGTIGKVIVRVHRTSDGFESPIETVYSATAEVIGPTGGTPRLYWRRRAEDL